MKNFYSWFYLAIVLFVAGCSSSEEPIFHENSHISKSVSVTRSIDAEDALDIANKVLGRRLTRSGNDRPKFEYVINNYKTRSNAFVPDTLAYVINYPNNTGFVIVASDRKIYPVLAFSEAGSFSFDNEIAKDNFINNIGAYIEEAEGNATYEVTENDFDGCRAVTPMVQASLDQGDPWNKYIVKDHPGCPAGCVAVATCLVMTHSKIDLNYHGSNFKFKTIITAINNSQNQSYDSSSISSIKEIETYNGTETYSYEQAVDSIAKILYWIGKDVDMTYSILGSGANSYNAYSLCKSLGFNIPSGYAKFDILEVTQYLSEDHIVYMRGPDVNGKGGHAWVSDGCMYCIDSNDNTKILDSYIHCDWGWGGSCNGYYSGSVFSASSYNFRPENYFAVKREWNIFSFIKP